MLESFSKASRAAVIASSFLPICASVAATFAWDVAVFVSCATFLYKESKVSKSFAWARRFGICPTSFSLEKKYLLSSAAFACSMAFSFSPAYEYAMLKIQYPVEVSLSKSIGYWILSIAYSYAGEKEKA